MIIRPFSQEDRPAVIDLMKQSLGESFIPKSEELWIWKHERNPFGPSYVLLAEEDNKLIGLRAFMQWNWQWKNKIYKSIRAVDTATHPQHQGKGIFKKLTMQQVTSCKEEGIHFVFNTPNEQSRPGYLKMGWIEQGKMPLKLKIKKPISIVFSKLLNRSNNTESKEPIQTQVWSKEVCELVKSAVIIKERIKTVLSPEYLLWRYGNNPLFHYNYITDHESFLLITRIKHHSFTKELRITDFILLKENASGSEINSYIKKAVSKFCIKNNIGFIAISGQVFKMYQPFLKWMGMLPVKNWGPIVTLRDLNMNESFPLLADQNNWGYSLGDMELF